jgi:uncharacterized protein YdhG (YjbR/CyaY superfamily)
MTEIDTFFESLNDLERDALQRIREIVHETIPSVTEVISYGMPGFKYKGAYLMGFCAFKKHLSLFPTAEPIEVFKEQLAEFTLSKGTIQFTVENPIPEPLIKEIILSRVASIESKSK